MENIIQQKEIKSTWIEQVPGPNTAIKYHLFSYLISNVFFWLSWFSYGTNVDMHSRLPWPFYPMLFGAVALILHFLAICLSPEKSPEVKNIRSSNKI